MKNVLRALTLVVAVMLCSAHVGSPDVWFEGPAGPYHVRVLVRPPSVVPGLADIVVDVEGARAVYVTAASGISMEPGSSPPPDQAKPREGVTGSYSAQLWLMARGSYRVVVRVEGDRGPGTAFVPVNASASERKPMPRFLGLLLIGGLLFLFVGLISIVGSAVRESLLPPGERAAADNLKRARVGMLTALVVTGAILLIGWNWWGAVDRAHRFRLDHSWSATASVDTTLPGAPMVNFAITDSVWLQRNDSSLRRRIGPSLDPNLIPDHGKIMHMFLVHEDGMKALAHLHPTSPDDEHFRASLPPLPAGRYRVFADIVGYFGAARTVVASLDVPDLRRTSAVPFSPSDSDDATWAIRGVADVNATEQRPGDGLIFTWMGPSTFRVNEPAELRGVLTDAQRTPVSLQPYMGMAGHAVVANADGSVYVHLHPMGTISMAALAQVMGGKATPVPPEPMVHAQIKVTPEASILAFPYAFPRAGRYRVWMQMKYNDVIVTAAHDVDVTDR